MYRSPSEWLGNIRLSLQSLALSQQASPKTIGKLTKHLLIVRLFSHPPNRTGSVFSSIFPAFLRFRNILRTSYHAHNGWQVGVIALFSDKDSLVQDKFSLDVLSATEKATPKDYERRSRFSITQCLPVPSLVCLWHIRSLPEQLLALRNADLR